MIKSVYVRSVQIVDFECELPLELEGITLGTNIDFGHHARLQKKLI